jgi:hypothetical protein
VLFKFLASSVGRKYQIAEISLNASSIGNRGLLAISEYLQGNKVLKELFLQNVVQCIFLNAMILTPLESINLTEIRPWAAQIRTAS